MYWVYPKTNINQYNIGGNTFELQYAGNFAANDKVAPLVAYTRAVGSRALSLGHLNKISRESGICLKNSSE